jgi:hypothetical protein
MLLPFLSLSQLSLSLLLHPLSLSLSHLIAVFSPSTAGCDSPPPPSLPEVLLHLYLPRLLPFLSKHKSAAKKVQIIKKTSEFKAAGKLASATRVKREKYISAALTGRPPWCSLQCRLT